MANNCAMCSMAKPPGSGPPFTNWVSFLFLFVFFVVVVIPFVGWGCGMHSVARQGSLRC